MQNIDLDELKKIELDILMEFDRICQTYNLRYSIAYGTLIGAVRHKGFIPWDDDIDVWMPRPDYEKLLELDINSDRFEIKSYRFSNDYFYPISKMVDKTTVLIENAHKDKNMGVFIDIFPMDFFDVENEDDILAYKKKAHRIWLLTSTLGVKPFYHKSVTYTAKSLLKFICYPFRNKLLNYSDTRNLHYKTGNYCAQVVHTVGYPRFFEATIWDELITLDFEGKKVLAFKVYDKVLTEEYGDYMQLPPESDRVPSHDFIAYYK